MAILSPDHLFEQAERLIETPASGPPRQVDVRRAISSAYYGVFHATMTELADLFVGVVKRGTSQYALVYRTVDHARLRSFCEDAKKQSLPDKYINFAPKSFGGGIQAFATAVIDLQRKRHAADCDPLGRFKSSDALFAVRTARTALDRLREAGAERVVFLTLLLFPPRG